MTEERARPRRDETSEERASLLRSICLVILALMVPFTALGLVASPDPALAVTIYASVGALHLAVLGLLRAGRTRLGGVVHIVAYWCVALLLTFLLGGISETHAALFITVTLLAGLSLGRGAGLVVAAASTVAILVLGAIEHAGALPPSLMPLGLGEDATSLVANLIFASLFVHLSMGALERVQARDRARAEAGAALGRLGERVVTASTAAAVARDAAHTLATHLRAEVTVLERGPGAHLHVLAAHGLRRPDAAAPLFRADAPLLAPLLEPGTRGRMFTSDEARSVAPELGACLVTPIPGHRRAHGLVLVEAADALEHETFVATVAGMLGSAIEREESQILLQRAQKMEVVGRLAGGVAHDFNNLLTTIVGCSTLLLEDLPAGGEEAALARDVLTAAERASLMTGQLLAFSKKNVLRPVVVDLNALVRELRPVLRRLLRSDIDVQITTGAEPAFVEVDPAGVEQVLLNLAVNARDAMPEGGHLRVGARTIGGPTPAAVELVVEDDGCGMDAATRERLFEPFFTTKPDGTGLGLSTVFAIVQRSGGTIEVESRTGEGAVFRVRFPAASPPLAPAPAPDRSAGKERVLVVDDEDLVRRTTRRILEADGYQVIEAATVEEALGHVRGDPDLALVVSDVVMPGGGGRRVGESVAGRVPILFVRGYADGELAGARPEDAFLAKPYTREAFSQRVRETIDRSRGRRDS